MLFFFTQWTQLHLITVYPQLSGVHLFSLRLPKLSLSDGSIGDREQREKIKLNKNRRVNKAYGEHTADNM